MNVGILALQGCVDPHIAMLQQIGIEGRKIFAPEDLGHVEKLILPGGESTTMLKLLNSTGLFAAIKDFATFKPVWGICAGAILCAKEVVHPAQQSLSLIDIRAHRNFYGSQLDSFKDNIVVKGLAHPIAVDFIRAPRLEPLNSSVSILATKSDTPILLRQGNILVSAFHTELGTDAALHRYFVENVK